MVSNAKTPKWLSILPDGTHAVNEGAAQVLFSDKQVFYNPVQEFNRDMSIAAINVFSEMFIQERVEKRNKKKRARTDSSENESISINDGPQSDSVSVAEEPVATQVNVKEQEHVSESNIVDPKDASTSSKISRHDERLQQQEQALRQAAAKVNFETIDLDSEEYKNEKISILEALSASGLRSIRFAKEIKAAGKIVANDLDQKAVDAIQKNVAHNQVEKIVVPNQGDACQVMYKAIASGSLYDVIDLDPYGSASMFLDGAVQAVSNGGLLCITCTDAAVLAGSQPASCWAKYGAMNIPGAPYTHELALRILLHSIQSTAAKYRRYIEPLASCSIDFYVRVFVRVRDSALMVKQAASKTSMVYHCAGCKSFVLQPLGRFIQNGNSLKYNNASGPTVGTNCEHCGGVFHIGGPFYSDPIHSQEFLARMMRHIQVEKQEKYGTRNRMIGMLAVLSEEMDTPFYFDLAKMSGVLHCTSPSMVAFVSALLHQGYKVSSSHAATTSIKTDAPHSVVWDVMRNWCKTIAPPKDASETSPAHHILSKDPSFVACFDKHPEWQPSSKKFKLVRYQVNPTDHWGPKARPGKKRKQESLDASKSSDTTPA